MLAANLVEHWAAKKAYWSADQMAEHWVDNWVYQRVGQKEH